MAGPHRPTHRHADRFVSSARADRPDIADVHSLSVPRYRRNVPSRIVSLWEFRRWVDGFSGMFPSRHALSGNAHYFNEKIALSADLIEGDRARVEVQRECARGLITACAALMAAKPIWAGEYRVTCVIALPDMFTSEICIYLDQAYFRSKLDTCADAHGHQSPIVGRSLASEWGLSLAPGMAERGMRLDYSASDDPWSCYVSEHWFYGEIA